VRERVVQHGPEGGRGALHAKDNRTDPEEEIVGLIEMRPFAGFLDPVVTLVGGVLEGQGVAPYLVKERLGGLVGGRLAVVVGDGGVGSGFVEGEKRLLRG
jgi:hypothetical protein